MWRGSQEDRACQRVRKLLLDKTHVHACVCAYTHTHTHPFLYHDSICLFGIREDTLIKMMQTTHKLKKHGPLNLNSGLHSFGTFPFLMAPDLLTSALIHKQWVSPKQVEKCSLSSEQAQLLVKAGINIRAFMV